MDQKLGNLYDEFSRLEARANVSSLFWKPLNGATSTDYDQVVQQAVEQDLIVRQLQIRSTASRLLAQQLARFEKIIAV